MGNSSSSSAAAAVRPLAAGTELGSRSQDDFFDIPSPGASSLTVASPAGQLRSRRSARRLIRSELFGPSAGDLSSRPLSEPVESPKPAADVQAMIGVLQEIKKNATPEDLLALHKALLPSGTDARDVRLDTRHLADAIVRRQSLYQQPGVATRIGPPSPRPTTHADNIHSQWSTNEIHSPSPLTKLAQLSEKRTATPSELSVRHLGNFKHGSLHITNGTTSPDPSVSGGHCTPRAHRNRPEPVGIAADEYYTASEGSSLTDHGGNDDDEVASRTPRPQHVGALHSPRPPRSPLGPRQQPSARFHSPAPSETSFSFPASANQPPAASLYLTEATSNPFLTLPGPRNTYPPLDGTYSSTHYTDEQEDVQRCGNDGNVLNRQLNGPSITTQRSFPLSTVSSVYLEQPATGSDPHRLPQNLKFDSGYASEASITPMSTATDDINPFDGMREIIAASKSDKRDLLGVPTSSRKSNSHQGPSSPLGSRIVLQARHSFSDARQVDMDSTQTSTDSLAISSAPSTPADTPVKSTAKVTPRKLQKKRRPTSQYQPSPESLLAYAPPSISTVPYVPDSILSQHSTRLEKHPQMDSLEHTFDSPASLTRPESSDTPADQTPYEIRFPSPTPPGEIGKLTKRGRDAKRRSYGSRRSSAGGFFASLSRRSSRSRDRSRRDSFNDDEGDEALSLTDMGDITKYLGASPYDFANPIKKEGQLNVDPKKINRATLSPYQLAPRPRSVLIGMDAKQASEWAMLRSKDRLANAGLRAQTRLRSYQPGRPSRPRSMYCDSPSDVPPVPALPGAKTDVDRPRSFHGQSLNFSSQQDQPDVETLHTSPYLRRAPLSAIDLTVNTRENISATQLQDEEDGWEVQARLWRQRRKSIGEGLRSRFGVTAAGPNENELEKASCGNAQHINVPQQKGNRASTTFHLPSDTSPSTNAVERSGSPTRSIRERAAMFERMSASGTDGAQSGTSSRTASPTRPKSTALRSGSASPTKQFARLP